MEVHPMSESEADRITRLGLADGAMFVEGTNDETHCENCNSGCPGICSGYPQKQPSVGVVHCATAVDRKKRAEKGPDLEENP